MIPAPVASGLQCAPLRRAIAPCLALLALVLGVTGPARAATPAATGTIEGRIFNPRSGTIAENARVSVDLASLVTFTDADGNFRLTQVPAGSVQLRIFYTGFPLQTESLTVAPDQIVQRDITLAVGKPETVEIFKLDKFVVDESREMEAAAIAINEQRFAPNVKNVVSTDEFGAVAEGNVAEFLRYMPGITVDLSGGDARTVSIDGAPAENTPVTLAGLSLSSPGNNNTVRSIEVGLFNLNNIARI
jgi:hypothetical protein